MSAGGDRGMTLAEIADLRQRLWDAGYHCLPVYSFDHPDRQRAGKAPLGANWQKRARSAPPECIRLDAAVAHAANTGIMADGLRIIDIDVDDAERARVVRTLARTVLGETIARHRDNSGRSALVYAAAAGSPTKRVLAGKLGKVEVLGHGQQLVVHGIHPSGRPLHWVPAGPEDSPRGELPVVSEDQITAFLAAVAALIEADPPQGERRAPNGQAGEHTAAGIADLDVIAALAVIPNDGPADWEHWNNAGLAVWLATAGAAHGFMAWAAWSAKHPSHDHDLCLERWKHFAESPPDRTGAGKLYAMAAKARPGWRRPSEPEPQIDDINIETEIARLARLPLLKYEQQYKAAAKLLGLRATMLERLVKAERGDDAADTRGQGKPLDLPSPALWPQPVNGAALLHNLRCYFARHLVLPKGGAVAMALWTVHCHCFDVFHFTPRMQFKSVTKGSGKSTAIQLFGYVVPRPLETETITQAFLYRAIEMARPTVLMDEADTYLRDDEDLRGMVNAGVKPGATAGRCVGDNQEPRVFSCHAPIALAGIGSLPGTIEDRSIKILMKRRLRGEAIRPIEDITRLLGERLQRKAARWARDHAAALRALRPDMKPLFNRAADRWRALYAIAEIAGGAWPRLAIDAMQALASAGDDDADTLSERLLADVKAIFTEVCPVTELPTAEIVERLILMDNRPWPEMGRSRKPLTPTRFTQMVGRFGVQRRRAYDPTSQKAGPWGFRLIDFDEAFGRYLDG